MSNGNESTVFFQRGFVVAVVANLLWGTTFLASAWTLEVWSPLQASSARFLLALPAIALVGVATGRRPKLPSTRRTWAMLAFIALTAYGVLYPLQLFGLKRIPSGLSAAVMFLSPVLVTLGASFLASERLSLRGLLGVILGLLGGLLLLQARPGVSLTDQLVTLSIGGEALVGFIATFCAAASLAISALATRAVAKSLDAFSITFWTIGMGAMMLTAAVVLVHGFVLPAAPSAKSGLAVLYLAFVCSAFAFFLWNQALASTKPQTIAATMYLKTPVAVVLGATFAQETVTPTLVLGVILVSVAVALASPLASRKAPAPPSISDHGRSAS